MPIRGPMDASKTPRFAGPPTFALLPRRDEVSSCDVAVVGVPFDTGTSYRPGARFGPAAVRQGSRLLRPWHPALQVGPLTEQQVADAGDIACNPFDITEAVGQIEAAAAELLSEAGHLLALGGDHTIAYPLLRATKQRFGPVALVHFDAHLDTWDTYFGAPYTHGTPFRRAAEEGRWTRGGASTSGSAARSTGPTTSRTTASSASRSSAATTTRPTGSPPSSSGCAPGSATVRSTSRSTSTCSTPRTRPAPARPRRAG